MTIIEVEAPVKAPIEEIITETLDETQETLIPKILRRASEIIRTIGWTQHTLGRNENGEEIDFDIDYEKANSYCMWGAVYRAEKEIRGSNITTIGNSTGTNLTWFNAGWHSFLSANWNDSEDRKVEEVVVKLDELADSYELGLIP